MWVVGKSGRQEEKYQSFKTDNIELASSLFERGHAGLYFRAPEDVSDALVGALNRSLWAGQFGSYTDGSGDPMGEVEVFISPKGAHTSWHTDFQENFTIQLSGSKTWRLASAPVPHPVRGITPHFAEGVPPALADVQVKAQLGCGSLGSNVHSFRDTPAPGPEAGQVVEVEVNEGDVLYHPAGVWHEVRNSGETPSISINISLVTASPADMLCDSLRLALWRTDQAGFWRRPVDCRSGGAQFRETIKDRIAGVKEMFRDVVEGAFPPFVFDADSPERTLLRVETDVRLADREYCGTGLRVNPCAVVVLEDETRGASAVGEEDEEDTDDGSGSCAFAILVHVGFGNADLSDRARCRVRVQGSPGHCTEFRLLLEFLRNAGKTISRGHDHGRWLLNDAAVVEKLVYCGVLLG